jgi:hypothetical protein
MSGSVVQIEAMDALVHHYYGREDLRILIYSADQWWSAEDYAEGIGWRSFFLGLDATHQDDGVAQLASSC